jgi:hypothetical protein
MGMQLHTLATQLVTAPGGLGRCACKVGASSIVVRNGAASGAVLL